MVIEKRNVTNCDLLKSIWLIKRIENLYASDMEVFEFFSASEERFFRQEFDRGEFVFHRHIFLNDNYHILLGKVEGIRIQ